MLYGYGGLLETSDVPFLFFELGLFVLVNTAPPNCISIVAQVSVTMIARLALS